MPGRFEATKRTVWTWADPNSGSIRLARVTHHFTTVEGLFVTLRDPETDASLGNYPINTLQEKQGENK